MTLCIIPTYYVRRKGKHRAYRNVRGFRAEYDGQQLRDARGQALVWKTRHAAEVALRQLYPTLAIAVCETESRQPTWSERNQP